MRYASTPTRCASRSLLREKRGGPRRGRAGRASCPLTITRWPPGSWCLRRFGNKRTLSGTFVIVFSSSVAKSDMDRAVPYAAAYVQKPIDRVEMVQLFEALETFLAAGCPFRHEAPDNFRM